MLYGVCRERGECQEACGLCEQIPKVGDRPKYQCKHWDTSEQMGVFTGKTFIVCLDCGAKLNPA